MLPQLGVVGVFLLLLMHPVPLISSSVVRFGERRDAEMLLSSRVIVTAMVAVIMFGVTEPISSTPLGWFCLCVLAATRTTHPRRATRQRHVACVGADSGVPDAGPLVVSSVRGQDEVHGTLGAVADRVVVWDDAPTPVAGHGDPHRLDDVGRV
ncbi:hypothetical protein [Nocardioides sp. B-3]|uniref:hypothetical protein n=1 Tax=Nocardioides sp. B-3 TaxID=2895565 RepID=UPI002152F67E|nr:hypothetical protein [Nocardioides sp. B-3]UUZ61050.1 hypothetical protein LP418_10530 [Nocardioides sp. B-3]